MLKIKEIATINGSLRYYISCDEKIEAVEKIHSKLVERETEELFCESTNVDGIYYFGCKQLREGNGHGAGYVWSSRVGCINGQFGLQLYDDCVINDVGGWHADINLLKTLMEDYTGMKYTVEQYYPGYDKDKEEPNYKLVEVQE